MIYIDTSAFVKLVRREPETSRLRAFLAERASPPALVSSALLAVEARRAAQHSHPRSIPRVDVMLATIDLVQITDAVVESAGRLPGKNLRSLDAIHLATVLLLGKDVEQLLCYDGRLREAAEGHGIATATPR